MNKIYRYGKLVLFLALVATLLCVCLGAMAEDCAPGSHVWYYNDDIVATMPCGTTKTVTDHCTVAGCTATWEHTIIIGPHNETAPQKDESLSYAPKCMVPGLEVKCTYCQRCGQKMSTTSTAIPALGHDPEWKPQVPATCLADGQERQICKRCGDVLDFRAINKLGHDYGNWTEETPATCTTPLVMKRVCSRDSSHVEREERGTALGHVWDLGAVTTPATCEGKGVKTYTCGRCSATRTEDIPALGHKWDAGTVTTPATCEGTGEKLYTCQNDSTHTQKETIPALGHKWNEGTVTKPATCEGTGEKLLTCTVCGQTKTETIPALGHKWDAGVVIKPATTTETGERLYTCQNDKTHTKTEKIPVITLANNTLCAIGPMLRDQRYYSAWYMFTPIDVSKDGRQTFDLIASKAHVVGTLTVEVRNGNMTVDYKVTGNTLKVTLEAFTVAGSMNEITRYEPEDLVYSGFRVRTPINLQETFGDDRNLILYFCSRCDYTVNQRWADFSEKSASYRSTVSQMLSLMDRDY